MVIRSKENSKIKYIKKLRINKYMNEEEKFIVEGKHLVLEAFLSNLLIETYSLSDDENYGVLNNVITNDIMKDISNLPSTPDVIGICSFVKERDTLGDKIIILDGVRDPGNLGTIIRSSKAFGIDTIVLSKECVNKYNEKVIRATQGMIFKSNIITRNLIDFIPYLIKEGYKVYGTDVNNGIDVKSANKNGRIAIIMGNEGTGLTREVKDLVNDNIYINIKKDCESLNVSVAASIIMYELSKGE